MTFPNPFTFGSTPPSYNSAAAAALASRFSSCLNSSGAMGMLDSTVFSKSGKVSGGSKLEDACKSTDGKPIGDDLGDLGRMDGKCELLQTDGSYDPDKLKAEKDRLDRITDLLQCRENKFKQVKSQLDCLTIQGNQITQQVNALQQTFTDSIHKMQQDVGDLASQSKNRQTQMEEINTKLSGDPKGSGSGGLIEAQKETRGLVAKMTAQISAVKEEQKKVTLQRQSLIEQAQQRTMGLAGDCFATQTRAEFRCYTSGTANNPAQSAKNYLLCRYRQNVTQVGKGGVISQNGIQTAVGNKKADELGSLLDEIFSEAPASKVSTDPKEFQQQMDKVVTVLSVADVERVYGARLKAYDDKGIPVHDYVMKYLGSCFQKATVTVQNERTKTNTNLGRAEEAIKALERQNSTVVRSYMSELATRYGENMKSLTGDHAPLDVSQCNDAAPAVQANCLDEALVNLNAQLTGVRPQATPNVSDYAMNIQIKGNNQTINGQSVPTDITIACSGLDGCVTKLQQFSSSLGREVQKIDAYKSEYTSKAYRNTEQFVQQIRNSLAPQSEALKNQLKTLNAALATLGVSELVKMDDVQGEDLQMEEGEPNKGLPKIPGNLLGMIGAKMTPPLLNVAADNFSSALGGISKAANDLKNKESKVEQAKRALGPLAETCRKKDLEAPIKEIIADANAFKGCIPYLCGQATEPPGSVADLAQSLRETNIPGLSGLSDASGILSSGQAECTRVQEAYKDKLSEAETRRDRAKAELEAADLAAKQAANNAGDGSDFNKNTAKQTAEAGLRAARIAFDSAEKDYNRIKRDGSGTGETSRSNSNTNCEKIATDIEYKFDKLKRQARDIASDASGAR